MKLISMTAFVLEEYETSRNPTKFEEKAFNYASFLNQTLTLGMFVPCDEDGNVLEKYKYFPCSLKYAKEINEYYNKYQQAKDKVLFETYTARKIEDYYLVLDSDGSNVWASWNKSKTIESLINEKTNVTLTPNAIKQLKL